MDTFIRCTIILIIRWAPRWLINVLECSEVPVTSVWEYFRTLMLQAAKLLRPTQVSRSSVAQEPPPDPTT